MNAPLMDARIRTARPPSRTHPVPAHSPQSVGPVGGLVGVGSLHSQVRLGVLTGHDGDASSSGPETSGSGPPAQRRAAKSHTGLCQSQPPAMGEEGMSGSGGGKSLAEGTWQMPKMSDRP